MKELTRRRLKPAPMKEEESPLLIVGYNRKKVSSVKLVNKDQNNQLANKILTSNTRATILILSSYIVLYAKSLAV